MPDPTAPRPQIRGLTCLTAEQSVPHVRHRWTWRDVEVSCPGVPEPDSDQPCDNPACGCHEVAEPESAAPRLDVPPMRGEDIPQTVLDAAQRGYSMHGAGLTANLIAAAWPEIAQQIRERVAAEIEDRSVWPDHFGAWTAEQAEAARTMKGYILARIARGES